MNMISFSFLLYFLPAMLVVYLVLAFSRKMQNLWLVLCSLAFYALGNWHYAALLLALSVVNYFLGFAAHRAFEKEKKQGGTVVVVLACIINLLPLFYFKYLPGLLSGMEALPSWMRWVSDMPLAAVGLSFFALQGISYVVDIRRGKAYWDGSFINTLLYLLFFAPHHAGPIIRYHQIAEQIEKRKYSLGQLFNGASRLVLGLGKIVLLGQPITAITEIIFSQSNLSGIYTTVPASLALLGVLTCVLGVYFYFSGFSDLVIGMGRMFGFVLPENFDHPIVATSVGNFWKRCFSTLQAWFDEYIYQPLEGRRKNNDYMVLHTLLMWVLIGLWIGPGLPNIILAVWSVIFIIVERIVEINDYKRTIIRQIIMVFFILVTAIAFQTETIYQFTLFISNLFGMRGNGFGSEFALLLLKENWLVLALGLFCAFPFGSKLRQKAETKGGFWGGIYGLFYPVLMLVVLALVVLSLSGSAYDPYQMIYFNIWS